MAFHAGNVKDGKHYWLTPPDLMRSLQLEFNFDYDPCPFPLPEGYDGFVAEWGKCCYVNPPFQPVMSGGKLKGVTAWAKKIIHEHTQGKKVVFVYPLDKWLLKLIAYATEIRNLGDVRWIATEDGSTGPGIGRHIAMFVFDPEKPARYNISDGPKETTDAGPCFNRYNPGSMAAPVNKDQLSLF